MSEMRNPCYKGGKAKWLKKLERLLWIAGVLALGFYTGARLYSSTYQAYAAYSFDEQLQGRAPSFKGFIVHLLGKANTSSNPAHAKKHVNGAELLRNMVYAPEIVPQGKSWSADRLRAYKKAPSPYSGSILGRLEIPSVDLSVMLLQGTDESGGFQAR